MTSLRRAPGHGPTRPNRPGTQDAPVLRCALRRGPEDGGVGGVRTASLGGAGSAVGATAVTVSAAGRQARGSAADPAGVAEPVGDVEGVRARVLVSGAWQATPLRCVERGVAPAGRAAAQA